MCEDFGPLESRRAGGSGRGRASGRHTRTRRHSSGRSRRRRRQRSSREGPTSAHASDLAHNLRLRLDLAQQRHARALPSAHARARAQVLAAAAVVDRADDARRGLEQVVRVRERAQRAHALAADHRAPVEGSGGEVNETDSPLSEPGVHQALLRRAHARVRLDKCLARALAAVAQGRGRARDDRVARRAARNASATDRAHERGESRAVVRQQLLRPALGAVPRVVPRERAAGAPATAAVRRGARLALRREQLCACCQLVRRVRPAQRLRRAPHRVLSAEGGPADRARERRERKRARGARARGRQQPPDRLIRREQRQLGPREAHAITVALVRCRGAPRVEHEKRVTALAQLQMVGERGEEGLHRECVHLVERAVERGHTRAPAVRATPADALVGRAVGRAVGRFERVGPQLVLEQAVDDLRHALAQLVRAHPVAVTQPQARLGSRPFVLVLLAVLLAAHVRAPESVVRRGSGGGGGRDEEVRQGRLERLKPAAEGMPRDVEA